MMSLLLSSVSASAIIAATPPPSTEVTAVYKGTDYSGDNNYDPTLSFDEIGTYIIALYGASGGAGGSDSPITLLDAGGYPIIQIGTYESNDYEEVTWGYVTITTPGDYQLDFTHSSTSYRRGASNWLISSNVDLNNIEFFFARGTGFSVDVPVKEDEVVLAAMSSRSGTVSMSGLDTVHMPSTAYEGTDIFAVYSEHISVEETKTIADTSVGTTNTRLIMAGVLLKPKPKEAHLYAHSFYAVLGNSNQAVSTSQHSLYAVLGQPENTAYTTNAATFVILE